MTGTVRAMLLIIRLGFAASPGAASAVAALLVTSVLLGTTFPLWAAQLVETQLRQGPAVESVAALGGVAVAYAAMLWVGGLALRVARTHAAAVEDHVEAVIIRRSFGVSEFRALERPPLSEALRDAAAHRGSLARAYVVVVQVVAAYGRFLVIVAILASIDWLLLLVPLVAAPTVLMSRRSHRLAQRGLQARSHQHGVLEDLLRVFASAPGRRDLTSEDGRSWLRAQLKQAHDRGAAAAHSDIRQSVRLSTVSWAVYGLVFGTVLLGVVVASRSGRVSPADALLAVLLVMLVRDQIAGLLGLVPVLTGLTRSAAGLVLLAEAAAGAGEEVTTTRAPVTGTVRARDVRFAYDDDTVVNLGDFEIPTGVVVCICGENGAGKSTLVKLLAGLYRPASGQLEVVDPARTAVMFEDFVEFSLRVREIVGLGDLAALDDDRRLLEAVDAVNMGAHVTALPHGLDTAVTHDAVAGYGLSRGQSQSYAAARCLVRDAPRLRILDEPTHSLDPEREAALLGRLLARARHEAREHGTTTLFTSHRLSSATRADQVLFVSPEQPVDIGPHRDLLSRNASYRCLFEAQRGQYT